MEDVDVVYHFGALARIQPSFKSPANTLEVGILGTMNILEWVRELENKPRVVFAGSSSVHSGKFKNPYTFSKVVADDLCLLYGKHFGVDVSICRFYNVYGDSQLTEGEYAAVVGIFLEQYKHNKPLTITGDGEQRRDFTHVDDIVDGMFLSMSKEFGTYELGSGVNYSINELANMFGEDYPKEYIEERVGEARETLCKKPDLLLVKNNLEDYIKGEISE